MKNKILKTLTFIALICWLTSTCMLDSETYIPAIINIISGCWIFLIGLANKDRFDNFD